MKVYVKLSTLNIKINNVYAFYGIQNRFFFKRAFLSHELLPKIKRIPARSMCYCVKLTAC